MEDEIEIELTNHNSNSNLLNNNSIESVYEEEISNREKSYKYYFIFPLNILLHILLLSICEMVLFFLYITTIENKALLDKISAFMKMMSNEMSEFNNNIFNIYFNFNQEKLEEINESLYNDYKNADDKRNENNNDLLGLSIRSSCAILIIFLTYFLVIYLIYKKEIKKFTIFSEHVILMFFIGVFEYWFFTNIVMKYISITNEEITYLAFNCLMKTISNNYHEFNISKDLYKKCIF